jgi:hypothetical protein
VVFLTLIPAIRRGRDYTRGNGSRWPWPFFPWSVFVFLALAVCGRAFLLCWSFHLLPNPSERVIFAPYFLVPFGLAIAVLLLEVGIVERNRMTRWIALAIPLGLVTIAALGHRSEAIYEEFLRHFTMRLGGSPLFVALSAAGVFYIYAQARHVPLALEGVTLVVVGFAFVSAETRVLGELRTPSWPPLALAVLLQVIIGVLRRDLWRLAMGAAAVLGWMSVVLWRGYRELRQDVAGLDYLAASLLILPLAVLISLAKGGVLLRRTVEERSQRAPE